MNREKPEVFISYHTRSAGDVVRKVCEALEAAGIPCWYAPRNVEGDYASSIVQGIRDCKVFLLILNKEADLSEDVRNEINCAFERFRAHEDISLLPFKIDACTLSDAVLYYLGRIHIMDGGLPPELLHTQELLDRITYILGRKQERSCYVLNEVSGSGLQPAQEKQLYRIIGSTISKDTSFVGRKRELEAMRAQLSEEPHKLFLTGMGGIGKSELTKAYCSLCRSEYDVMLWVSFDTSLRKTIANDFIFPIQGLLRHDYPQDDDEAYFLRKLRILNEISDRRVLIVLDNFDVEEDADLETFCNGNYSVLFTTRCREIYSGIPELEVGEITEEADLLELFSLEYKKQLDSAALSHVKELLHLLNGHPLSIRLFASAMKSNRISPEKMLELLKEGSSEVKKSGKKVADIVYGRLRQVFSLASLTEDEKAVLKNLVLMPLKGIDVEQFYEWCQFDDYDVIDGLIRKSWVIHDAAADQVHLHPLITDLMTEELEQDPDCCNALLDALLAMQKIMTYSTYEVTKLLYECFSAVSGKLPAGHPRKSEALLAWALMLFEQSWYEEAIPLMESVQSQTKELALYLRIAQRMAQGYALCGRPHDAIREAEKGLARVADTPYEELSVQEREEVIKLYTRMAEANRSLENFGTAEDYMRKTVELQERFAEQVPDETRAWTMMHLARVLSMKDNDKDRQESEELFAAIELLFAGIGNELSVGYTNMFWGQLKMFQGEFAEAFERNQTAHDKLLPYLGAGHVDLAKVKLFEANIHRAKGDEAAAVQCYDTAIDMMVEDKNPALAEKVRAIKESGKIGYTN